MQHLSHLEKAAVFTGFLIATVTLMKAIYGSFRCIEMPRWWYVLSGCILAVLGIGVVFDALIVGMALFDRIES